MGKLKLDLDALTVETFDTTSPDESQGTIYGNQTGFSCFPHTCQLCRTIPHTHCGWSCWVSGCNTCGPWATCGQATCAGTCAATCAATCQATCTCFSCHWGGCTVIPC